MAKWLNNEHVLFTQNICNIIITLYLLYYVLYYYAQIYIYINNDM